MNRVYDVAWSGPGVYVPRQITNELWLWELSSDKNPPVAGVYLADKKAANRLKESAKLN